MKRNHIVIVVLLAACGFFSASFPAYCDESNRSVEAILASIPVQDGGRVKPFKSFANESVLYLTGKTSFEKMSPTVLVWRWISRTDYWESKPLIPVSDPKIREFFKDDMVKNRVPPSIVIANQEFVAEIQKAQDKQRKKETLSEYDKKTLELYHKARLFYEISRGQMPGFVPNPDEMKASWLPLDSILSTEGNQILANFYPQELISKTRSSLDYFLGRFKEGDMRLAISSASFFFEALSNMLNSRDVILDETVLNYELFYLRTRPFHLAWILYLISIFIWLLPKSKGKLNWTAFGFFVGGFVLHSFGFVLRCMISGRPPVTNMYESVIWVAWGAILFSLILWLVYKSRLIPVIASTVAALALLIGENLPTVLDQSLSPLAPVLRNNFWLTIHVLTITLGYGAFLLNWGVAHALIYNYAFKKGKKNISYLTDFLYRTLQIGIILLAAGTILGGVWASYSWGRFWGWDPKETWALIAVLAYIALLHGRIAGWLDSFNVAFFSIFCFLTVVMAWYGVNFVLAAGLHSYGFGGGGTNYVLSVVAVDFVFLMLARSRYYSVARKRAS